MFDEPRLEQPKGARVWVSWKAALPIIGIITTLKENRSEGGLGCRYLSSQGSLKICTACTPERPVTRDELRSVCPLDNPTRCDFFRFIRATGRPILLEDYLAWRRKKAEVTASDTRSEETGSAEIGWTDTAQGT